MNKKKQRPKVNLPGVYKDMAMLAPDSRGRIDRSYIKAMCDAIDTYTKRRNENLRKINKELSNDD